MLYLLLQLHVLGALVAAHLEEVRGRAHPVLPHGVEVVVRDALLLAKLPAKSSSVYIAVDFQTMCNSYLTTGAMVG